MKTLKGNKKELIKEYKNFCKDFNFIPKYRASQKIFAEKWIENEIKYRGLFYNLNFISKNTEEVKNEIILILQ